MPVNWIISTHKTLPSTQDTIKNILKDNPDTPEGVVVFAQEQTHGYGRHGRRWQSGANNLYMSFIVRPKQTKGHPAQIALISGLTLIHTIEKVIDTKNIILKWPNDILIDNEKSAGILIEAIDDAFIVGIGVNVGNAPLDKTTCLNAHSTSTILPDELCRQFFEIFDDFYDDWLNKGFASFRDMFIKRTYPKGTHIGVNIDTHRVTGKFDNIDQDGNLILRCDETQNLRKITSGDVFLM